MDRKKLLLNLQSLIGNLTEGRRVVSSSDYTKGRQTVSMRLEAAKLLLLTKINPTSINLRIILRRAKYPCGLQGPGVLLSEVKRSPLLLFLIMLEEKHVISNHKIEPVIAYSKSGFITIPVISFYFVCTRCGWYTQWPAATI